MIYPRKCPTCSWKICIRWLLDGMFCICLYNHLDYGVIQIFSFFINYLSKRSSHFLRVKYCSYQLLFYWDLFLLLVLLAFALSTYWQSRPFTTMPLGNAPAEPSPGGGNDNPLQYPCLENSMDRRSRWATVPEVTDNKTRPSNWAWALYM